MGQPPRPAPAPESPALERMEGGPVLYEALASGFWAPPTWQILPVSCPALWPLRPGKGFRLPAHRQFSPGCLTLAHKPAVKAVVGGGAAWGHAFRAGSARHRPGGPRRTLLPAGLSWTTCGGDVFGQN